MFTMMPFPRATPTLTIGVEEEGALIHNYGTPVAGESVTDGELEKVFQRYRLDWTWDGGGVETRSRPHGYVGDLMEDLADIRRKMLRLCKKRNLKYLLAGCTPHDDSISGLHIHLGGVWDQRESLADMLFPYVPLFRLLSASSAFKDGESLCSAVTPDYLNRDYEHVLMSDTHETLELKTMDSQPDLRMIAALAALYQALVLAMLEKDMVVLGLLHKNNFDKSREGQEGWETSFYRPDGQTITPQETLHVLLDRLYPYAERLKSWVYLKWLTGLNVEKISNGQLIAVFEKTRRRGGGRRSAFVREATRQTIRGSVWPPQARVG